MSRTKAWLIGATLAAMYTAGASAAPLSHRLGDEDFFGFGSGVGSIGDAVPQFDFDNSQPGDPAHTDRDIRQSMMGPDSDNDVSFVHDLSAQLVFGDSVDVLVLRLAIGGIQDGDPRRILDNRIFIEGIEVAGAFDLLDQGALGTGFVEFALSSDQRLSFQLDGVLDVFIDGGKQAPGGIDVNFLDSYFLDYTEVYGSTASQAVPLPATLPLFATALAALGFAGWRRRTHDRRRAR